MSKDWKKATKVKASIAYLLQMLEMLDLSPPEFATRLYDIRYSRFVEDVPSALAKDWTACPTREELQDFQLTNNFSEQVEAVLDYVKNIQDAPNREIWLGNYVEIIANLLVDEKDELAAYMLCFKRLA